MRWVLFIYLFIGLFIIKAQFLVYAQSEYVLPYPSVMPGSIFYRLHLAKERLLKYWYFGDFGQFHYNLKQSDKYLVQAKIMFEYKQYLFALAALNKSNYYFKKAPVNLRAAWENKKNVDQKDRLLNEAALKHIEVLEKIITEVPSEFVWTPEDANPSQLYLHKEVSESISLRENVRWRPFEASTSEESIRPPPR